MDDSSENSDLRQRTTRKPKGALIDELGTFDFEDFVE